MHHRILIIALLGWANASLAVVYKCTNADGETSYQETPCEDAQELEVVEIETGQQISRPIRPVIIMQPPATVPRLPAAPQPSLTKAAKKKQDCKKLVTSYKALSESLRQACEDSRDTYCDESPEHIEAKRDTGLRFDPEMTLLYGLLDKRKRGRALKIIIDSKGCRL